MSSAKPFLIVGATGILGSALLSAMRERTDGVAGTSRRGAEAGAGMFRLDTSDERSVNAFPWDKFETVIDCSGSINYAMTPEAAAANLEANVVGPMRVVSRLSAGQRYFYCSTHVVLLPEGRHNTYSLSKKTAERYLGAVKAGPRIVILRVPGLFSEKRAAGIFHKVKTHFIEKKPLVLDFAAEHWHAMYAPRAAEIIARLAERPALPPVITVGYPVESSIVDVLAGAEKIFGRAIQVELKGNSTDHYRPALETDLGVGEEDYRRDVERFFRQP